MTHKQGHSEETELEAAADSSGGKNMIQAQASTITYLQRYTLLAATGLATKDQLDDDGRGAENGSPLPESDWIKTANLAADADELKAIWMAGVAELKKTGDMVAYNAFKDAVTAKGKTFPTTGEPS